MTPLQHTNEQCSDVVNGIAPALFDWLRLGTDAGEMCAQVGVCGAPPPALLAHSKVRRAEGGSRARVVAHRGATQLFACLGPSSPQPLHVRRW